MKRAAFGCVRWRALLASRRHSGFSMHDQVRIPAEDAEGRNKLARYMLRAPLRAAMTRVTRIEARAAREAAGAGAKIAAAMGAAYEAAKAGGKHNGFLVRHRELPDHLLAKAARSFLRRIREHQRWIARPEDKVDAGLDPRQVEHLVAAKWPKDIARNEDQLDIVRGILREKRR